MTRSRETGEVGYRAYKKNFIINGDMSLAQRGTTGATGLTVEAYTTVDRFFSARVSAGNWGSSQIAGQIHEFAYRMTAGSAGRFRNGQKIEGAYALRGKTFTITLKVVVPVTATDCVLQYIDSENVTQEMSFTPTGALQTLTETFTDSSASTVVNYATVRIETDGVEAGEHVEIHEVQLEEGSSATPFEYVSPQQNLAECQRYYEQFADSYELGRAYDNDSLMFQFIKFSQVKRAVPIITGSLTGGTLGTRSVGVEGVSIYNSAANWTPNQRVTLSGLVADAEL